MPSINLINKIFENKITTIKLFQDFFNNFVNITSINLEKFTYTETKDEYSGPYIELCYTDKNISLEIQIYETSYIKLLINGRRIKLFYDTTLNNITNHIPEEYIPILFNNPK